MEDKVYHKIDTLWEFDNETKKHIAGKFKNPYVELLKDNVWLFTEKLDGTNFRIMWDGYNISYAGRTNKAEFSKKQKEFIETELVNESLENLIEQMFGEKEVIIYGELFGGDIQTKAGYNRDNYQFKLFDIMVGGVYLEHHNMVDVANNLGLGHAPLVVVGTIEDAINYVKNTETSVFCDAVLEGVVGRPKGDFYTRQGKRIIVKIKKRDLGE